MIVEFWNFSSTVWTGAKIRRLQWNKFCSRCSLRKWHCLSEIKTSLLETSRFSLQCITFLLIIFLEINRRGRWRDRKENRWYWWSKPLQYWTWETESRARSNGQTCWGEKAGNCFFSHLLLSLVKVARVGPRGPLAVSRENGQVFWGCQLNT